MRSVLPAVIAAIASGVASASVYAAATVTPLSTFGTNGWLQPGSSAYLGTANNERGIAYGNGHLYLVSRTGGTFVRILDSQTGSDLGGLSTTGVSGGTFTLNTIGVSGDGTIYANNLTTASNTTAFTVYSWANESATPTVAYSGAGLSGARIGDSLAVTGSGSSTLLAVGFGNTPAVTGNNGYGIISPSSSAFTSVSFTSPAPSAGDFRLGITFTDSSHVLGSQGSSLYRDSSYSGSAGTLIASPAIPDPSGATADRLLAYAVVDGVPVLAVQSIGDAHVSIYDVTDPTTPVYLASGRAIPNGTNPVTNGNGTGELAWNIAPDGTATLYAMSTNAGIQAFTVSIPEPASFGLALPAAALLVARRRR